MKFCKGFHPQILLVKPEFLTVLQWNRRLIYLPYIHGLQEILPIEGNIGNNNHEVERK